MVGQTVVLLLFECMDIEWTAGCFHPLCERSQQRVDKCLVVEYAMDVGAHTAATDPTSVSLTLFVHRERSGISCGAVVSEDGGSAVNLISFQPSVVFFSCQMETGLPGGFALMDGGADGL